MKQSNYWYLVCKFLGDIYDILVLDGSLPLQVDRVMGVLAQGGLDLVPLDVHAPGHLLTRHSLVHLGGAAPGLPLVHKTSLRVKVSGEAAVGLAHSDLDIIEDAALAVALRHELFDVLEAEVVADDVGVSRLVGEIHHHVLGDGPSGLRLLCPLHWTSDTHRLEVKSLLTIMGHKMVTLSVNSNVTSRDN